MVIYFHTLLFVNKEENVQWCAIKWNQNERVMGGSWNKYKWYDREQ